jgi:hypothetical protein
LAHLEPAYQVGEILVGAGFQFALGLAAFLIFGDERGAIAGFVGAILRIQAFHGAGFVLGGLFLAHQAGEGLADFRLPSGDFHGLKHER